MKELLQKLGITQPGYYSSSDTYVIDFENSDQYSKAFSKLDRSDLVEEIQDSSISTVTVSNVLYANNNYSLNLIANFEDDEYKLVIHSM